MTQVDEQLALASYSTESSQFTLTTAQFETERGQSVPTLLHRLFLHNVTMTERHYLPLQPIRG